MPPGQYRLFRRSWEKGCRLEPFLLHDGHYSHFIPEMVILRKVLKVKLLVIFAAILAVAIIMVGYLFNAIM